MTSTWRISPQEANSYVPKDGVRLAGNSPSIHFALFQASRDCFSVGFASMQVFSFSYKLMLSWDNFNLCRLLVLWRGQWGKRGWARRLQREQEVALRKRLVWLTKKKLRSAITLPSRDFFYFAQERGPAQQTIKSYFSKVSSSSLCTSQSKPRHPPPRDMWGFSRALLPYWQLFGSPVCGGFARFFAFVLRNVGH